MIGAEYVITAIVQPAKDSQWLSVSYLTRNPDIEWHRVTILQREYYSVASVKVRDADAAILQELKRDAQGNMKRINSNTLMAPNTEVANEHVVENGDTDSSD